MGRKPRSQAKTRINLQVTPEDVEQLKSIALSANLTIPVGEHVGEGSVSALMRAIARLPEDKKEILKILLQTP